MIDKIKIKKGVLLTGAILKGFQELKNKETVVPLGKLINKMAQEVFDASHKVNGEITKIASDLKIEAKQSPQGKVPVFKDEKQKEAYLVKLDELQTQEVEIGSPVLKLRYPSIKPSMLEIFDGLIEFL